MDTPSSQTHKGWYSRGYVPHFDQPGLLQGITYRLHDSMPVERRAEWEVLLRIPSTSVQRERIEAYPDACYGSCVLRDPGVPEIVQENLLHFDGHRYRLLAWVVMPNHVHVLIETREGYPLPRIIHSWKSYTANRANQLLGRSGPFWQRDYFDRYIRDQRHLERAVGYIHDNPVKAGLVENAEDWSFSSARWLPVLEGDAL